MKANKESKWQQCRESNLIRYLNTGVYYLSATVGGRKVGPKSLKTTDRDIAIERRDAELKTLREAAERGAGVEQGRLLFGTCAETYLSQIKEGRKLEDGDIISKWDGQRRGERSIEYIEESLGALKRHWKELWEKDVRRISEHEAKEKFDDLKEEYSGSRFNGLLWRFRACLEVAEKRGVVSKNIGKKIDPVPVGGKKVQIPTPEEFRRIVENIDNNASEQKKGKGFGGKGGGAHNCHKVAQFVQFLAATGLRIHETWPLRKEHIEVIENPTNGLRAWLNPPTRKYDEGGDSPSVPIFENVWPIVEEWLKADRKALCPVKDCLTSLASACERLGLKKIVQHDLRDIAATRWIEAGYEIEQVAKWLGHHDGGKIANERYIRWTRRAALNAINRVHASQQLQTLGLKPEELAIVTKLLRSGALTQLQQAA